VHRRAGALLLTIVVVLSGSRVVPAHVARLMPRHVHVSSRSVGQERTDAKRVTGQPTITIAVTGWTVVLPTTTTTTTTLPVASVSRPATDATSTDTADWACIREHESGDDYQAGGDEPQGGAYQFSVTTWQGLGFAGVPNDNSPAVQDAAALALYAWDLKYTGNPWYAWQTAPACGLW